MEKSLAERRVATENLCVIGLGVDVIRTQLGSNGEIQGVDNECFALLTRPHFVPLRQPRFDLGRSGRGAGIALVIRHRHGQGLSALLGVGILHGTIYGSDVQAADPRRNRRAGQRDRGQWGVGSSTASTAIAEIEVPGIGHIRDSAHRGNIRMRSCRSARQTIYSGSTARVILDDTLADSSRQYRIEGAGEGKEMVLGKGKGVAWRARRATTPAGPARAVSRASRSRVYPAAQKSSQHSQGFRFVIARHSPH
jgi:hypothetical protein